MKYIQFDSIFSQGRWITPGIVELDASGRIVRVTSDTALLSHCPPAAQHGLQHLEEHADTTSAKQTLHDLPRQPRPERPIERIPGWAIPGFCNGHSHAFQYAMTGITEHRPQAAALDDFWSWRETMYQVALAMDPDELEDTAAMLYGEMLRYGYTSVVEFHYLHHDQQGKTYQHPAEMSLRLMAAAKQSGIRLILVPVLYQKGGFQTPPTQRQRRFIFKEIDAYFALLEDCKKAVIHAKDADISLGLGVHSLRAVDPEMVLKVFSHAFAGPRHMHLAEQRKEVDACKHILGVSPTRWVLDQLHIDDRTFLTHSTHSTREEVRELAGRQGNVVLCPSTEGNLGDGFFPLVDFLTREASKSGGFLLGSDSHMGLSPLEELRWLDYTQRLRLEKRNPLCQADGDDSARVLFDALARGRRGCGDPNDLAPGDLLDCVVVQPDHPIFCGKPEERRLSVLFYCGDPTVYQGVMRRGRWLVVHGRHVRHNTLTAAYARAQVRLAQKVNLVFT